MKKIIGCVGVILLLFVFSRITPIESAAAARLIKGQRIYVPIYSSIYVGDKGRHMNLTSTLSIRNTSTTSSILISQIDYYDSYGRKLKEFTMSPISLDPLTTIDVVVSELDTTGGAGANFLVRWDSKRRTSAPIVEAVMLGSDSGQSYSFISRGEEIEVD